MEGYVEICSLDNEFEAQVLEDILQEKKIPFQVRSFYDLAYGALFQFQNGWGAVYSPEEYRLEIEQTLEEIRKAPGLEDFEEE